MKTGQKERLRARLAQETREDPGLWEDIEARLSYPVRPPDVSLPGRGRRAAAQAFKTTAAAAAMMALILGAVWMIPRLNGSPAPEDSGSLSSAEAEGEIPFKSALFRYGIPCREAIDFPLARRVDSAEELAAFRTAYESADYPVDNGAFVSYTAEFFNTRTLLLVIIEEPSGSITHQVTGLRRYFRCSSGRTS